MGFYFPTIETDNSSRDFQEQFNGYNHNLKIAETEFYDMKNMTGDYYPVLSTRDKRGKLKSVNNLKGMICKGELCYIDQIDDTAHLYIGDEEVTAFAEATEISQSGNDKEMVVSGAYLVVFDKTENGLDNGWYVNTTAFEDCGSIDAEIFSIYPTKGEYAIFQTDKDGNLIVPNFAGVSDPSDDDRVELYNGAIWLDTSSTSSLSMKKWSATQNMWVEMTDLYITIRFVEMKIGNITMRLSVEPFAVGDCVKFSLSDNATATHFWNVDANKNTIISDATAIDILRKQIDNKQLIISSINYDEKTITIPGVIGGDITAFSGIIAMTKKAPLMDFVCESNNRLWGCRYGVNRDGETVNEIYACKQGDFKNWFCYAGISTDSYAVSVGSEGAWTGCIAHGSYVYFFKENSVHKLYGTMPSNYQLIEQKIRGVQQGSEKSLCVVNETIFYKSATDFCYYDGAVPVSVSNPLGRVRYSDVICSTIKTKIYINAKDPEDKWHLFVYDIATGLWHKEDNIQIKAMCRVDSDVYYVDSENNMGTFTGTGTPEDDFEWYAETGNIGYSYSDNKYIGRMLLRIKKPLTSEMRLLISYDDNENWELVSSLQGQGIQSYSMPVLPRRCDHFRLRLEGKGECKVFSLSKTIEIGSDI